MKGAGAGADPGLAYPPLFDGVRGADGLGAKDGVRGAEGREYPPLDLPDRPPARAQASSADPATSTSVTADTGAHASGVASIGATASTALARMARRRLRIVMVPSILPGCRAPGQHPCADGEPRGRCHPSVATANVA